MALSLGGNVRNVARRLWRTLPEELRRSIRPPRPRGEAGASWYDAAYAEGAAMYGCHYTASPYYFVWSVIADRARAARGVLEIGCGPGQLAQLLFEQGCVRYTGFDFSARAVGMARERVPGWTFHVDDARTSALYRTAEYDTAICTEVLEHIEHDLEVLSHIPPRTRVLATVPSFDSASHVRFFANADEVRARYAQMFATVDVVVMPSSPLNRFYLIDGVRG